MRMPPLPTSPTSPPRTPTDAEQTLPSVHASLAKRYGEQDLMLTVIFHPDTQRIGHRAVVPQDAGKSPWLLGRFSPLFHSPAGGAPAPLDDPFISRRALQFTLRGKHLLISRFETSSRCRVGPSELYTDVELEWDMLRAGVPLFLGHSIVLLLRLVNASASSVAVGASEALLLGSSACMSRIREQVARIAGSDLDVLVRGESGTGKELVATAIHHASRRAGAPMISVNMAAIPGELAPAALFGSARGAFTGADRAVPGYFEQASGGSLFLDEIGDTAPEVQPLLLRALQQRELQVVGGPVRRVDVRVISATDAALDGADSDFKLALRHRLSACEIVLPPLREHPEDVGELLLHFLQVSAAAAGRTDLLPHAHSAPMEVAAWAVLFLAFVSYSWPGNVRQLANFAQQVVLASDRMPVMNEHLQAAFAGANSSTGCASPARRSMQAIDDDTFAQAMRANDFEVMRVAHSLGVSRAAVYRRIEASSAYRLASDIPDEELHSRVIEHGGDSAAVARQLRVSVAGLRARLRKSPLDWY
jgi:two-component system nitrogen regulation response regulator GlnG